MSVAGASPSGGVTPSVERAARRDVLVWATFLVAFSPVLADLFRHLLARPWSSYSLLFAVLLVVYGHREASRDGSRADGYALLAAALAVQVVAVGGGFTRWGRLAIPIGVIGLARLRGRPPLRVAALAFWAIPIPHAIAEAASPVLARFWLECAAALLAPFAPVVVEGTKATAPNGSLLLGVVSSGLPLSALLSGLGWVSLLDTSRGVGDALRAAVVWGVAALPLQALCVAIALSLTVAGAPRIAHGWISWGVLVVSGGVGLLIATRPRGRATLFFRAATGRAD